MGLCKLSPLYVSHRSCFQAEVSMPNIAERQPKCLRHFRPSSGWMQSKHFLKSRLSRKLPPFSKSRWSWSIALATLFPWRPPQAAACIQERIHVLVESLRNHAEQITRQMAHWMEMGLISFALIAPSCRTVAPGFCNCICLVDFQTSGTSPRSICKSSDKMRQALNGSCATSEPSSWTLLSY